MAMTIKGNPILYGEDAKVFVEEAERNGKLPNPGLTASQKEFVKKILESGRNFSF